MSLDNLRDDIKNSKEAPKTPPRAPPKRLSPPKESKVQSTTELSVNEKRKIVNDELIRQAISSDNKRNRYYTITGTTWRGNNDNLDLELYEFMLNSKTVKANPKAIKIMEKNPEVVEIVEEIGRGTTADKKAVIAEMKEALAKRREMIEE